MFRFITGCKHQIELLHFTGLLIFKCKKCAREWDTAGVERVPEGFESCKELDEYKKDRGLIPVGLQYKDDLMTPRLPAKQMAPFLVEWVIRQSKDPDIEKLRNFAKDDPDKFVRQVNQQMGVKMR